MVSSPGVYAQELYRYAGDTSTSYYKAVKGWQDASRMKNEVRGGPRFLEFSIGRASDGNKISSDLLASKNERTRTCYSAWKAPPREGSGRR